MVECKLCNQLRAANISPFCVECRIKLEGLIKTDETRKWLIERLAEYTVGALRSANARYRAAKEDHSTGQSDT